MGLARKKDHLMTLNNVLLQGKKTNFAYTEQGSGEVIVLLHGLMGTLGNWETVIDGFSKHYRVIVPSLPIYSGSYPANLKGLTDFLKDFIAALGLEQFTLVGNSLGGHLALLHALHHPEQINALVLTGSSGLYERTMSQAFPRRGDFEYIKKKVKYIFYSPEIATKKLFDEIYEVANNISKALRVISFAKSTQRTNLSKELHKVKPPTFLIWGLNDTVTPPMVAHEFHRKIPDTRLFFIDKCSHAPMMEHPAVFQQQVLGYLAALGNKRK